jgi:short subunit dehydrogenase-like uncharacterized protein
MDKDFLLYGANGFVGRVIARKAIERGLKPVLAGRNESEIGDLARKLDLEFRIFLLEDEGAVYKALDDTAVVLHCAGPFMSTYDSMVKSCLRAGTHYLDLAGEVPVFQGVSECDKEAKRRGIMLLPGAGFDVLVTDCLAVHLKRRLPLATRLTLAFHSDGPAGIPPGTVNSFLGLIPKGDWVREDGQLAPAPRREKNRQIDFGQGQKEATLLTWGDIFMAYHSTGIPNIENYAVLTVEMRWLMRAIRYARPFFSLEAVRNILRGNIETGSTADERAASVTYVWGEVADKQGRRAISRLRGPEAGVDWTTICALDMLERVLSGGFKPGFQVPGSAYGPDLVMDSRATTCEDVV